MRTSGWRWAALAGGVLLAGCRSHTCEDFAATYAGVAAKSQPCMDTVPLPPFDAKQCEANLQACDDRDVSQLDAQRECYEQLATCQPDQKAAFLQGLTECDDHALSNACEAAIF